MTKTKKKKQTEKLYCPYCGRMAVLRPAKHVYGSRNLDSGNYLYVCSGYPSCDSYIGVHKKTMRPMGTLANGDLLTYHSISSTGVGWAFKVICATLPFFILITRSAIGVNAEL